MTNEETTRTSEQKPYIEKCEAFFSTEAENLQILFQDVVGKMQENKDMHDKYSSEIEKCEANLTVESQQMEETKRKKLEQLEQLLKWD